MRLSFRKKKSEVKENKIKNKGKKEPTPLERLCGEDKALYEDLSWSMFLDPRDKGTYVEAIKEAERLESEGKTTLARIKYQVAASLALYEGNIEGVRIAYTKLSSLSARKYDAILANPEKAIKIAQKYYQTELKPLKEKEPE